MSYKNLTKFKSLDKIAYHKAVREIWDKGKDGLWIYLNAGWVDFGGDTEIHAWTVADLITMFKTVYYKGV